MATAGVGAQNTDVSLLRGIKPHGLLRLKVWCRRGEDAFSWVVYRRGWLAVVKPVVLATTPRLESLRTSVVGLVVASAAKA